MKFKEIHAIDPEALEKEVNKFLDNTDIINQSVNIDYIHNVFYAWITYDSMKDMRNSLLKQFNDFSPWPPNQTNLPNQFLKTFVSDSKEGI